MSSKFLGFSTGPQDSLLFDNSRSYFTNVGYVRTSNFSMELRDIDPQTSADLGGTANFVIPKAADLLGPCDLMIEFNKATNTQDIGGTAGWVDTVGYAMIEKITFSVGSHDVEVLTGDHLNIINELMRSDQQRYGYNQTLKTGRPLCKAECEGGETGATSGTFARYLDADMTTNSRDRIIMNDTDVKDGKKLCVPLGLFFTQHPSKYFPLGAIAGSNEVRIAVKFRTLNELLQLQPKLEVEDDGSVEFDTTLAQVTAPTFGTSVLKSASTKLRCHYIHVTGPEATQLMNREHVRLMKLFHGNEVRKVFTVPCSPGGSSKTLDIDLSFLHPVQELVITIRKVSDMGSSTQTNLKIRDLDTGGATNPFTAKTKNYFAYHGSGRGDPNPDAWENTLEFDSTANTFVGSGCFLKVKDFQLRLNGSTAHLDGQGLDRDYLMNRLMPMLHSNTSTEFQEVADASMVSGIGTRTNNSANGAADFKHLAELFDRKEIYVFPFALNPEGANPSGSVNFSKVSHAKLTINVDGLRTAVSDSDTGASDEDFQVDVYGVHFNWLAIKDGRALTSFA